MPIIDIFSKRQKKLRGENPDFYVYDALPNPLRVQIVQIWTDTIGGHREVYSKLPLGGARDAYKFIVESLRHEYGVFRLSETVIAGRGCIDELFEFFLQEQDVEKALDAIELSFHCINVSKRHEGSKTGDKAIQELNERFNEHGVGYYFSPPHIVRTDSELIHSEVVKPALRLLNQKHYAGAQEEFLKAHDHYRKGNSKEALSNCLNAFESVMKAICDKRGWSYDKSATSKSLIQTCFDNGLIPSFWQSHYSSLRSLLESSVPTGRNKLSGHGQGTKRVAVPDHLVAYMLHMTASAIVFFAEAEKDLP